MVSLGPTAVEACAHTFVLRFLWNKHTKKVTWSLYQMVAESVVVIGEYKRGGGAKTLKEPECKERPECQEKPES